MLDISVWEIFDPIVAEYPDREIIVSSDVRRTYSEFRERAVRLAAYFHAREIGCHVERADLARHESGQDHVGILMGNRPEYMEAVMGALRARAAPVNLNYRYTAAELAKLLDTAKVNVLVYESDLAPTVAEALAGREMKALVEVGGNASTLLTGAIAFESIVSSGPATPPPVAPSPDDLFVACTGGTTGMPKGVLWRQGDLLAAVIGNPHTITNGPADTVDDLIAASRRSPLRMLLGPPLMHFSGFGTSIMLMTIGGVTILTDPPRGLDPAKFWQTVEREKVRIVTVVGDAFGRPLLDELRKGHYDTGALLAMFNGGAAMSNAVKEGLYQALGKIVISDGVGSTEGGMQGRAVWRGGGQAAVYQPGPSTALLSADRSRLLARNENELGWLGTSGRVPLGYLGEARKTSETFPVIDGKRYSIPGDRARWRSDGEFDMLGRDSVTINSGGEKVFAEEVQRAIETHPAIAEAIVVGRPSERWGQEVVALVVVNPGTAIDHRAVVDHAASTLARYKLPKALIEVEAIARTAMGKPDYVWAKAVAASPEYASL
jgi:3-oxocholest-4-en-26-oate---CoA ligase